MRPKLAFDASANHVFSSHIPAESPACAICMTR